MTEHLSPFRRAVIRFLDVLVYAITAAGFVLVLWLGWAVYSCLAPPSEEELQAREQTRAADEARRSEVLAVEMWALDRELARFDSSPCQTGLRFEHAFGWYLTCDGCAWVEANRFFPKDTLLLVDRFAVDGRLNVTEFLQVVGECR